MLIYLCKNKINNKLYVGQTARTLNERIEEHKRKSLYTEPKTNFHKAILKYGFDNFEWNIVSFCEDKKEMNELEMFIISEIKDLYGKKFLYNMTEGGDG